MFSCYYLFNYYLILKSNLYKNNNYQIIFQSKDYSENKEKKKYSSIYSIIYQFEYLFWDVSGNHKNMHDLTINTIQIAHNFFKRI
jgi:hypothetical protein